MKIRVFTDGSCLENPGPGGWAAVFAFESGVKTLSGNEKQTTNNRMELLAATKALEKASMLCFDEIEIVSDSAYVVNAITKGWLEVWKRNGWKNAKGKDVKNKDLWEKLDSVILGCKSNIFFKKVKGHSGNTFNELADELARAESMKVK